MEESPNVFLPESERGRRMHTRQELLRVRLGSYFCNLFGQGMPLYLILKLWMSPFIWGMVALHAATGYRVIDQNEEGCMQTPGERQCAKQ